jgi:hypothetical protein
MSNERQASQDAMRVDNGAAQRLLARAAELDALTDSTSIAELRQAAREAGISTIAFEAALRELRDDRGIAGRDDVPASPAATISWRTRSMMGDRRRWMLRALTAATVLVAVGAAAAGLRRAHPVPAAGHPHTVRAVGARAMTAPAAGARATPSPKP